MSRLWVGVDIGGTFTDFALRDESTSSLLVHKALTTPEEPSQGVLAGLDDLLAQAQADIRDVEFLTHATTLATNAVLERASRPIGLISTRGFKDVIQIQRQKRHELYNLFENKITPLVERSDTFEVSERLDSSGRVRIPLSDADVAAAATWAKDRSFPAVAVCFLHSYANPVHEERVREIFREQAPETLVSLSSDVAPVIREYERTNTVVVNAYVLPLMRDYLLRLMDGLTRRGFRRRLYLLNSGGGLMTGDSAARYPVRVIESGPAAGALMASRVAGQTGRQDLVAFDMGGTSAKVCLITGGRPTIAQRFEIERSHAHPGSGLPIAVPAVDLVEIGRGGGSIATVNNGVLEVGPNSASATPGPACYGRGGTKPTVTDANLLLGYLDPDYFLGGRMALDLSAAEDAIRTHVAEPLGLSPVEAAWGIHALVNAKMAAAARLVTIQRGLDPRDLAFVAFGGAGPTHAARLAREIEAPEVIVPPGAGVSSAIGLLHADVGFDIGRTAIIQVEERLPDKIVDLLTDIGTQGRELLQRTEVKGRREYAFSVDMRYAGQGHEINVPFPKKFGASKFCAALLSAFHPRYQQLFGFSTRSHAVEAVTWRVRAMIPRDSLIATNPQLATDPRADRLSQGYFPEWGGWLATRVVDRASLVRGATVPGPAIIQEREASTVVVPGMEARLDEFANLVIS